MIVKQGISVNCDRQNITKCDPCILNLVRQHLMQKDENTPTFNTPKFNKKQQILTQIKQVFDQLGVILLTHEGQVQFMTQRGEQLLNQYFSLDASNALPEPLYHWFNHQIALQTFNGKVSSLDLPLRIEQAGKQLLVRLICDRIGKQYLLLLQEQELQSFSVSSLELLGLTPREAEVLFWVAQDKSNAAIAKVLGCSQGTIRKHLEHIH